MKTAIATLLLLASAVGAQTVPKCMLGTLDIGEETSKISSHACAAFQTIYARGRSDQKSEDWTPYTGPAWHKESCVVGDMKLPDLTPRIVCGLAKSAYERGLSNGQKVPPTAQTTPKKAQPTLTDFCHGKRPCPWIIIPPDTVSMRSPDGLRVDRMSDEEYAKLKAARKALDDAEKSIEREHGVDFGQHCDPPTGYAVACDAVYDPADTVELRGQFLLIQHYPQPPTPSWVIPANHSDGDLNPMPVAKPEVKK